MIRPLICLGSALFLVLSGIEAQNLSGKTESIAAATIAQEAVQSLFWYKDADNDGYGDSDLNTPIVYDWEQPEGHVANDDDCDDSSAAVNPDAMEVCDGIDNNCDGRIDEGFDADGDGYTTCNGDCDDTKALIYPGATESNNDGVDQDCDGTDNVSTDIDDKLVEVLSVYPNPTKGTVYMKGFGLKQSAADVRVYDFTGKLIVNSIIQDGECVDLSRFNNGIYLLQIKVEDQIINTRIVKK